MKTYTRLQLLSLLIITSLQLSAQPETKNIAFTRERLSFDNGWRFHLGDIPFPIIKGHGTTYANAKAGRAWGAAAPDYNDKNWRLVNLPHDWAVEQPFDSTANVSQGYRPRGIGWYRRNFKLDTSDRGKHLEIQVDGVATHCTVWINGTVVHRNWSGYTSFYIDMTALAKYGNEVNNIVIRVDAVNQEGWWYEGAGIYRHTWLVKRSPVHIMTDGVFAHPVKNSNGSWSIPVEATIENSGSATTDYEIEVTLFDKEGKQVVKGNATAGVKALGHSLAKLTLPVSNPALWSIENPALYKVKTVVKRNSVLYDSLITTCGFRTIRFDADSGFYLNDKRIKIKGVCNHQDHAGVGVAVPNSIWDFRLKKLKEMGVNGYRCAHNPPAAEFLEACDRVGILVMDENRNFNSSPEYIRQLEWMVRRDRNHPSIILWSVFNEEPMQGTEIGYEMVRRMSSVVKELDTTRPVTAAANGGLFSPRNVTQAVDVVGFNYQINAYDPFRKAHPEMKLTSSEDASGLMMRGEYKNNKQQHLIEAYDTQWPVWGANHRTAWKVVAERAFLAGCFVWTGFDYRGEPQPYEWPTADASFGIMDQCGFPKTAFYIHQAQWVENKNILHVVPHWNWPKDSIGKNIRVMALSNADRVKLYLNGKLLQDSPVDKYEMNTWQVPYQPGKIEAVSFKGGKEVARFAVETTGDPVSVQLIADRETIAGEGWDAVPVTVRVLDAKGRAVENANLPIEFEISGPGNIIGLANGNPNSHEAEKGNKRSLYNGLAQVILQSKAGSLGKLVLTAKSKGLKDAVVSITVTDAPKIPMVEVAN
ncbi:MAG: glycoside hydrolase family 2 protein [Ferruginibacter sp.]|nr:glycoside hydrolase family 2 protein [Ferruginibacter sp.]